MNSWLNFAVIFSLFTRRPWKWGILRVSLRVSVEWEGFLILKRKIGSFSKNRHFGDWSVEVRVQHGFKLTEYLSHDEVSYQRRRNLAEFAAVLFVTNGIHAVELLLRPLTVPRRKKIKQSFLGGFFVPEQKRFLLQTQNKKTPLNSLENLFWKKKKLTSVISISDFSDGSANWVKPTKQLYNSEKVLLSIS